MNGLAEMTTDPNGAKPFASLSPTLLARKGAARPAMRPQLTPLGHFSESVPQPVEDDLGWNDMGHDMGHESDHAVARVHADGEVVAFAPPHGAPVAGEFAAALPEVVRQREEVALRVAAPAPVIPIKPAAPRRSALTDGRRAAFTLRLDGERHLKLRLACTIANRSAQQLVTEALDRLLDEVPEVGALAAQVAKRR